MGLKKFNSIVCALAALLTSIASADVKLPAMFADHMVLQRDAEIRVWGTASPRDQIAIEVAGKSSSAVADENGNWSLKLPAMKSGDATSMIVEAAGKRTVFNDVLIGDVWVCSGQSNMGFRLETSDNGKEEVAKAEHPNIRLFQVPQATALEPTKELKAEWKVCTPDSAAHFSAVGYFFGREIHEREHVPVGLIANAWGGMPAESFTSKETLESDPDLAMLLHKTVKSATAPAQGSNIYNAMVYPVIPYTIKGAIWYQGESNAPRAAQYRKLFPAMIADWRKQWGQGDFPFLFVQLANWTIPDKRNQKAETWAELREAQTMTLKKSPNTGMAVTIDIGDEKNIHPTNKQDVGKRLALAAEKIAYGKDIEYSGPMYDSMKVEGNDVRLKFRHADGLKFKGEKLRGFEVAGEDQKFSPATARIDKGEVVVSSEQVSKPAAVRYGWTDNPTCNLYNSADLPASPFRTDDWPMVTAHEK
jgi:sialate O-acetylesterase